MSIEIKKNLVRAVTESAIHAAWIQWGALGSRVTAARPARSMVDPEALVLLSLALRDHERRLWDVLAAWAAAGSTFLSVQRIKNLGASYPGRTAHRLAEFARIAVHEGGDHRWRTLAGARSGPPRRAQSLARTGAGEWPTAALLLRLRLGIGVGLHADVLAFLLAQQGAWASARQIADATGYTVYAIRRTADRMAEARLIESTARKPVEFRADASAWSGVLGVQERVVPWGHWHQAYAFIAELVALADDGQLKAPTPYLLSSRLRDLVSKHRDAFRLNRLASPEPGRFPGEEFLPAFEEFAEAFAAWMRDGA